MFTNFVQTRKFSGFGVVPTPFDKIIDAAADAHNIDSNLIRAVIRTESNFDPNATRYEAKLGTSSVGLMQVLPSTASSVMGKTVTEQDLKDPYKNIMIGTQYLKQQMTRYNNYMPLAVSAYNAGHALVDSHGNIVNKDYVTKVLNNLEYYRTGRMPLTIPRGIPMAVGLSLGLILLGGIVIMTTPPKQNYSIN